LALYVDNTAVIATSRQPTLLTKNLEIYRSDLEWQLSEWRIAINVSKSSAMLFAKTSRCIPKPRPVHLFRQPIQWVDCVCYLGVAWSKHIDQVKKKAMQRLGEAISPSGMVFCCISSSSIP
jgi:hypothetical protein